MDLANRVTCPSCHAPLKSARGVRIGRKIKCPKCGIAFTVRPADADQLDRAAGVNPTRLAVVLAGALCFFAAGSGLAYYCFTNNTPRAPVAPKSDPIRSADSGEQLTPPKPPPPRTNSEASSLSLAEQRRIDNAIANGVWYLKDHAFTEGVFNDPHAVGVTSLAALTLLECGIPPDDPHVQKTAAFVREHAIQPDIAYPTYQRSLAVLFLDRLGERGDEEIIQYLALCIMAGQNPAQGAWHYNCPALDRRLMPQLLKALADEKQTFIEWRRLALNGGKFNTGGWDNSNTQFAVLALWVAQRHGVPIGRSARLVDAHFRKTQQPAGERDDTGNNENLGGSWLYDTRGNSSRWPSMTCSGLLALAVAHGAAETHEGNPKTDPAIERALAMLAREIDRPNDPRPHDLYFLWSLERVGVLYDLPKIGGKDWYAWGRKDLLARQQKAGNWEAGGYWGNNSILDTCFALLFLKQANLVKDLSNKLRLLGIAVTASPSVQAPAKKE